MFQPNIPERRYESIASCASHVTLQTVRVWGSLVLHTLFNALLIIPPLGYNSHASSYPMLQLLHVHVHVYMQWNLSLWAPLK